MCCVLVPVHVHIMHLMYMYVCKTCWRYTIHKYTHVYIRCALSVCVCEMHAHAFALHLCIAHLCAHLSGSDNDCNNSNTTSTTANYESVPCSTCKNTQGQSLVMKKSTTACDGARVELVHQEKHALQWTLKKTNMSKPLGVQQSSAEEHA